MTITEVKQAIADGKSVRSIIEASIERARKDNKNAILSLVEEGALARADEIDNRLAAGEDVGVLAGVPFLAKDNILAFGAPTTAASKMLENYEAPYQATVIKKLEAAGAILIGKTNLDAFAHGGSTENSFFGPTKNAHDDSRVAGGSSGGSAVAVATGVVPFALGTDTGGSIRQPASFNGVVGFKPTYGSVSRFGVIAMASSTDVVGPIASTTDDADLVFQVISGLDENDSTTIETPTDKKSVKKIGVVKQFLTDDIDNSVKTLIEEAIDKFRAANYEVVEIDLPIMKYALAVYYIVVPAELSSNLARFDGIRYGLRGEANDLTHAYTLSRNEGFTKENKRRILIGNYVLSSGYYDAYYQKAQKVRTKIIDAFKEAYELCDVLIGPVAPTPAFKIGEKINDPLSMYMADTMTTPASLAGLSAISVPAGSTKEGMPVGLQMMMPMGGDRSILEFAKEWERLNV